MKITDEVFDGILYISRLSVDDCERERLSKQISSIVDYFQVLDKFVKPNLTANIVPNDENAFRSSEVKPGIDSTSLKKMSDEYMDGYFRVPKVLEN